MGLIINHEKTVYVSTEQLRKQGVPLLGSFVGNAEGRRKFLETKIENEIVKINNLRQLSKQEGLLLLRQCLNQDLKHLLRSLDTVGLEDLWKRLDRSFYAYTDNLRACRSNKDTDHEIYSLPISLGGCGIISHLEIRDSARLASQTASKYVLEHLSSFDTFEFNEIPTQRNMCKGIFRKRRDDLIEKLSVEEGRIFLDNCNQLQNSLFNTLPLFPSLTISDKEISTLLHLRTLVAGNAHLSNCPDCSIPNSAGHDERCTGKPNQRLARHELIKKKLHSVVAKSGSEVAFEPFINQSQSGLRADLLISGPAALNGSNLLTDITVTSIVSRKSTLAASCQMSSKDISTVQQLRAGNRKALELRFKAKMSRYDNLTHLDFMPFVMSSSGTLHSVTSKFISHLKSVGVQVGRLRMEIAIILLKCRAKNFKFQ
jgi:hypothetical protein